MILLAVCLVKVDVIKVPSYPPHFPNGSFVAYNASSDVFIDRGWINDKQICNGQAVDNIMINEVCGRPVVSPAKNELVVLLRDDVIKDDSWKYVTAGVIYSRQVRKPERQIDSFGKSCYTFDCTASPFTPPGMEIVMHSGGKFEWDPHKIKLYTPQHSQGDNLVSGYDFLRELAGKKTLNGTALEYLLSSPFLIPREWRGRQILFLGTIYKDRAQTYYSSTLFHDGGRWIASSLQLDYEVYASSLAVAVLT